MRFILGVLVVRSRTDGGAVSDVQLSVRNLRKTFDPGLLRSKVEVLRDLSFEVKKGEIFGFLGPNGAGKTTTIKAITGIIHPDEGEITVCGLSHTDLDAKRRFGFMSENPYFYNHLTGGEFLRFSAELLGIDRGRVEGRISEVLDLVSMAGHADRPMRTLSKGMLQRMGLAQALLGEPELLILDEPLSGLDPVGRRDVRDIILAQRERGTTVFFSSHIIPDVETICDRVAIVVDGTVRAIGTVRDLVAREVEAYELTFVGADPGRLITPVLSWHEGSDACWARVANENRDALTRELADAGARLVSLAPVRSTLEDFLLQQFEGNES
jgi:ABC-2 type transport system ATP-binding protein